MKKVISIFLFFASILVFAQGEGIHFQDHLSFSELLKKAKEEKKIIFIDAFASWCGPCKQMARDIFPAPSVKDYFNTNFVNARFDMEKGEGRDIARKYGVGSYPTFLFLNSEGEIVGREMGYMEADTFLEAAKEANSPFNKNGSLKEQFEAGVSDSDFLMNIIKSYSNTDFEFAKKASERYFQTKKSEAYSRDEINALLVFIKSTNDVNYAVFVRDKAAIIKLVPENVYHQFDSQIKLNDLQEQSIDKVHQKINDEFFMSNATKMLSEKEAREALDRFKMNYYPTVNNFDEFEKAAIEYYADPNNADVSELNRVSMIFSEYSKNPASLKKALEWAQKSVMRGESEQNTYVLAKLYYKLNDKDNAKNFAEISKILAKQNGRDTKYADDLLKLINN